GPQRHVAKHTPPVQSGEGDTRADHFARLREQAAQAAARRSSVLACAGCVRVHLTALPSPTTDSGGQVIVWDDRAGEQAHFPRATPSMARAPAVTRPQVLLGPQAG